MRSTPQLEIVTLQEELTLVKMRDAEAQSNIDELRQRFDEIQRLWKSHVDQCETGKPSNQHDVLSTKMREAQVDCEKKILSQQLMDIETQKQVLLNQLKRQDEEIQRIRRDLEQSQQRENDLRSQLNEMKHHLHDGELRVRSKTILCRRKFSIFL